MGQINGTPQIGITSPRFLFTADVTGLGQALMGISQDDLNIRFEGPLVVAGNQHDIYEPLALLQPDTKYYLQIAVLDEITGDPLAVATGLTFYTGLNTPRVIVPPPLSGSVVGVTP